MNVNRIFLKVVVFVAWGCSSDSDSIIIPEKFQNLENLTAYSSNVDPLSTFSFEKDMVYGETNDLIIGSMGQAVVDKLGRVYIADVQMMVLNVFDTDGNFIK